MESQLPQIAAVLHQKAEVRKAIAQVMRDVFQAFESLSKSVVQTLNQHFEQGKSELRVEFKESGEQEFHLRFGNDVLIFTLQPHVTTLMEEHIVLKSPYVQENPARGFFGSILVYNFMADSIRFNRLGDLGYLMARILVNYEGHFYIEGVRQLNFLHPDIAQNKLDTQILLGIVESCMATAIEQDLVAPNYQDIQVLTLEIKQATQANGAASKVGFHNSAKREEQPS